MTVREESRPPVVEERGQFGVSFCLLKQKAVARRVLLGCDDGYHVDEPAVAVLAGERQHYPVPLPLQMSGINCNHLTERYGRQNREQTYSLNLKKT